MEKISVYPELNPKVRGNCKFEHSRAWALIFTYDWSFGIVKRYNNDVRILFLVFRMTRLHLNFEIYLNINIIIKRIKHDY